MAQAKQLNTGNKAARKAGKAATYCVTQEAFDACFDAGRAYAGAYHAAAAALEPILRPLSGKVGDDNAVAQWRELCRGFCLGMAEAREIDEDSARRAFGRICDYLGLDKPQTQKAHDLAVKRAKEREAAGNAEPANPVEDTGAEAQAAVQMGLSSMEAHLIGLVRAGKYTQAAECVAAMADAAK